MNRPDHEGAKKKVLELDEEIKELQKYGEPEDSNVEYYKKRNALYSQRKYYKAKYLTNELLDDKKFLEEKNAALRAQNENLESILTWANEQVRLYESSSKMTPLSLPNNQPLQIAQPTEFASALRSTLEITPSRPSSGSLASSQISGRSAQSREQDSADLLALMSSGRPAGQIASQLDNFTTNSFNTVRQEPSSLPPQGLLDVSGSDLFLRQFRSLPLTAGSAANASFPVPRDQQRREHLPNSSNLQQAQQLGLDAIRGEIYAPELPQPSWRMPSNRIGAQPPNFHMNEGSLMASLATGQSSLAIPSQWSNLLNGFAETASRTQDGAGLGNAMMAPAPNLDLSSSNYALQQFLADSRNSRTQPRVTADRPSLLDTRSNNTYFTQTTLPQTEALLREQLMANSISGNEFSQFNSQTFNPTSSLAAGMAANNQYNMVAQMNQPSTAPQLDRMDSQALLRELLLRSQPSGGSSSAFGPTSSTVDTAATAASLTLNQQYLTEPSAFHGSVANINDQHAALQSLFNRRESSSSESQAGRFGMTETTAALQPFASLSSAELADYAYTATPQAKKRRAPDDEFTSTMTGGNKKPPPGQR